MSKRGRPRTISSNATEVPKTNNNRKVKTAHKRTRPSNTSHESEFHQNIERICPYEIEEKVLCYEPDPLKFKVLYEAKILEIATKPDDSGKLVFEYLVHFQGWSSSWDRYVADDLIVKDNENSRKLQDELNSLAAEQRKKLKQRKMKRNADSHNGLGDPPAKKIRTMISSRRYGKREIQYHFIQVTDPECTEASAGGIIEEEDGYFRMNVTLTEEFRSLLELDYFLIQVENKLPTLPSSDPLAYIVEKFVKTTALKKFDRWYKKYEWEVASDSSTAAQVIPGFLQSISGSSNGSNLLSSNSTEVKTPPDLLRNINEVEIMKQLSVDLVLTFDTLVAQILLYEPEQSRHEESMQLTPTPKELWQYDLPECINNTESVPSNGKNPSQGSDSDDLRMEVRHCQEQIRAVVGDLLKWNLVSEEGIYARPSLIYGLPHLLRLLLKMPDVFGKLDLSRIRIQQVATFINRLLKFILNNFDQSHMKYEDNPRLDSDESDFV